MIKNFRRCVPLLPAIAFVVILFSCKKDDNPPIPNNTVKDIDGNAYHFVIIGTQTWMVENLRTTNYKDGASITNVTGASEWSNLTTGAYCNYNNTTNTDTIATYGRLYNWYAVNTGLLAPTGWHVATNAEWSTLTDYLGGESVAGGKLKETGTTHWIDINTDATNETGFTAHPGGYRYYYGIFLYFGYSGIWWSDTEDGAEDAWVRGMYSNYSDVYRLKGSKEMGFSVRCVKD